MEREKQRAPGFSEIRSKARQIPIAAYCSHPDAPGGCSGKTIKSHTVQRNGGLAAIAAKGHVISPMAGVEDLERNGGALIPRPVGIGTASTFLGYCNAHDTALFLPVENGSLPVGKEMAFLLSIRAVALERFRKHETITQFEGLKSQIDAGRSFGDQANMQQVFADALEGSRLGLRDASRRKDDYDAAYRDPSRGTFGYYCVAFDSILPIVSCGAFAPVTDLEGNELQALDDSQTLDMLAFNLTVIGGKSVVAFGWMIPDGPGDKFAQSFERISHNRMANVAVLIALRTIENTYFNPPWWQSQPHKVQRALSRELATLADKFGLVDRDGLRREDGSLLVTAGVNAVAHSW